MGEKDCLKQAEKYKHKAEQDDLNAYYYASYYFVAGLQFQEAAEMLARYKKEKRILLEEGELATIDILIKNLKEYDVAKRFHEMIFSPTLSPFDNDFFEKWAKETRNKVDGFLVKENGKLVRKPQIVPPLYNNPKPFVEQMSEELMRIFPREMDRMAFFYYVSNAEFVLDARKLLRK